MEIWADIIRFIHSKELVENIIKKQDQITKLIAKQTDRSTAEKIIV